VVKTKEIATLAGIVSLVSFVEQTIVEDMIIVMQIAVKDELVMEGSIAVQRQTNVV